MIALMTGVVTIELLLLFFISRVSIKRLFQVLHTFFRRDTMVFSIISAIYIPGTIIHELSHFFMAIVLFLKVRDIHIFPTWDGSYIKLGSVTYEKKDVFRSILVGIAPIIVGILLFWWLYSIRIFESESMFFKISMLYVVFIISSTMFSSKQDLVDIVYIIPLGIIIGGIIYVFGIDITALFSQDGVLAGVQEFLYAIAIYLGISIGVHIGAVGILSFLLHISKR
ncbi:hypothetical protein KBD81_02585 [Candidatus Woesebacteria bacterium]|nr:hypothetical protein [Candidatus Woesebacteria bacterium]